MYRKGNVLARNYQGKDKLICKQITAKAWFKTLRG